MKINEITNSQWDDFTKLLKEHYDKEDYLFTEDLIRYLFVNYLKEIDPTRLNSINNTKIEVPYLRGDKTKLKIKPNCPIKLKQNKKGKNRSRADLYYCDEDEVVEFKFSRCTEYSKSCTNSDLGALLNDFNRLSILENNNKYSIYVCDEYMKNYLTNNHKDRFPFLYYNNDNKLSKSFKYEEEYYSCPKFKDILKHAFSSFLNEEDFYNNPSSFDLKKFGYEINLLYSNKIKKKEQDLQKNLYLFIFEII